jgi:hypothetical protein
MSEVAAALVKLPLLATLGCTNFVHYRNMHRFANEITKIVSMHPNHCSTTGMPDMSSTCE